MGSGTTLVFVDSNVIYSRTLRDWLCLLYLAPESYVFRVVWSEDVWVEAAYHLRRDHPEWDGEQITKIRSRLEETFSLQDSYPFQAEFAEVVSDPHDLHVHAAAVAARADILLTSNTEDFGTPEEYDLMTPDEFFTLVDDSSREITHRATERQLAYWNKIHCGVTEDDGDLVQCLVKAGCPQFALRVKSTLQEISKATAESPARKACSVSS